MTVFTKPLNDPAVVALLKAEGKTVLEVQVTRYYLIDHAVDMPLEALAQEWFVRYAGQSHAFRDGSHVGGGGDRVSSVKVLTEGNRLVLGGGGCPCGCDCLPCQSCDHK